MAVFDQRYQNVNYQYNAAGNINFEHVENRADVVTVLVKLCDEVRVASQAGVVNSRMAFDVETSVSEAIAEARQPNPNKASILRNLDLAKSLLQGITAVGGLVAAISKASELIQRFF
jgi:hypothetical protein